MTTWQTEFYATTRGGGWGVGKLQGKVMLHQNIHVKPKVLPFQLHFLTLTHIHNTHARIHTHTSRQGHRQLNKECGVGLHKSMISSWYTEGLWLVGLSWHCVWAWHSKQYWFISCDRARVEKRMLPLELLLLFSNLKCAMSTEELLCMYQTGFKGHLCMYQTEFKGQMDVWNRGRTLQTANPMKTSSWLRILHLMP